MQIILNTPETNTKQIPKGTLLNLDSTVILGYLAILFGCIAAFKTSQCSPLCLAKDYNLKTHDA